MYEPQIRPPADISVTSGRSWAWPRSIREARIHAVLTASVLWVVAITALTAGTGNRSIAGPLKGADFVHFYTIGFAARTQPGALYDVAALHRLQVSLVQESEPETYIPIYPPHAALMFAPLSIVPYGVALSIWLGVTVGLFALIVYSAWRPVAVWLDDRRFVIAAAATFPPFWSLVLHGQSTIVILIAFWAGWLALERRRRFLAGMAFGLLLLKPQWAIVLAVTALLCGEWTMIAGALTSIALQTACVGLLLGWPVLGAYAALLPVVFSNSGLLEPKPFQMHSLSALTQLLPAWLGAPLWAGLSAVVVFYAIRAWKSASPVRVRLGVVILASALVNPHLTIYDATCVALPLIWLGAYVLEHGRPEQVTTFWVLVYWMFVTLLAPTALAIKVQVSVVLMVWMGACLRGIIWPRERRTSGLRRSAAVD